MRWQFSQNDDKAGASSLNQCWRTWANPWCSNCGAGCAVKELVNIWANKFCIIRMNIKSKIVMCFIGVFLVIYIFFHVNMEKKYLKDTDCL